MKKLSQAGIAGIAAVILVTLCALPLAAQEAKPEQPAASAEPTPAPAPASVKAEIMRQITDAESKLVALADAEPADKYGWRPGEGVRSVGEVYVHVAFANYFFPSVWGVKAPAGLGKPADVEKSHGADKAKALEFMRNSFAHVKKAIADLPDADLDKPVKLFGRDSTNWEALLLVATHAHEHLGQAIAYARVNGIVPPWSRRGE
jgi:uncharacterized damage-inducible protein DinB